jgi:tRNA threonylcarbamoyladenosine biosynthesis protein TsaB
MNLLPLLALDSSGTTTCAALFTHDQRLSVQSHDRQGHSQRLLHLVDELMRGAQLLPAQLGAIAVVHGPGSFTGLRVAVGVAQGLSLGVACPVIGVDALQAAAMAAQTTNTVLLVCNDARLSEVYFAAYRSGADGLLSTLIAPSLADATTCLQAFDPLRLANSACTFVALGSGFKNYSAFEALKLAVTDLPLSLAYGAALVALHAPAELFVPARQLVPLYLRNKVALTSIEQQAARAAR